MEIILPSPYVEAGPVYIYLIIKKKYDEIQWMCENCGLRLRRECRKRFPRHHGLAIPTCITARAWRTCRDTCRDRLRAVSFEVGDGKTFPAFSAHAQPAILRSW